ncbi:MAG: sugar ABC transporter ATP-binding protein [Oceanospirillaceae bacterium]|nr:sugar ABC transporter ATP-binding protein [Oceanospirillaceae bacterium]
MSKAILAARKLSKSFGTNQVLSDIEFEVHPGAAVALCGENGAGKSTLIKLMTGLYQPSSGHIEFCSEKVNWRTPSEGIDAGVAVVHQEFSTMSALSVAENIFIEALPRTRWGLIDRKKLRVQTVNLLDSLEIQLDPDQIVAQLSVAQSQMVEIAKALRTSAKVLILDEPSAVLSQLETQHLFKIINALRLKGLAIVYVSHRLDEIFEICTDIAVIKDGVVTSAGPIADYDQQKIIAAMVGRELGDMFPPKASIERLSEVVLELQQLRNNSFDQAVDLSLYRGEILGIAGLVGSGRTELAQSIYGARAATGRVLLEGRELGKRTPSKCLSAGIAMLTEGRKTDGLFAQSSVAHNYISSTISKGASDFNIATDLAAQRSATVVAQFNVVVDDLGLPISHLSGGNQQKILLGRLLENQPKVLILDEPTRGVDVGAKAEIYRHLRALANSGLAILVISSELIEIVGLCDRVCVMRDGAIAAQLQADEISEDNIMSVAAADDSEQQPLDIEVQCVNVKSISSTQAPI